MMTDGQVLALMASWVLFTVVGTVAGWFYAHLRPRPCLFCRTAERRGEGSR